ncbi:MAG: hypothetical protein LAT51_02195 [Flavobacteriaceae bacterium]|nr:hypothetical protein [Flavobacteriaceae bacterium]
MKIRNLIFLMLAVFTFSFSFGQKKKYQQDVEAIKSMCGCYEVTFKYTETFSPEIDYEKAYDYTSGALEWAEAIVDEKGKIVIQHILSVGENRVIKHWRQDWTYEDPTSFVYDKNHQWKFFKRDKKDVKGTWTQKVYQVDDSPRYAGTATWVHYDGKQYWESADDSPLPRREYTTRDDYNVMNRGNRHEITNYGWVHEQDNKKILRKEGEQDVLIAEEKGFNIYKKVDDKKCEAAKDWWQENKEYWDLVNAKWDEVYAREGNLKLAEKVEEHPLFMHLTPQEDKDDKQHIEEVFAKFILN